MAVTAPRLRVLVVSAEENDGRVAARVAQNVGCELCGTIGHGSHAVGAVIDLLPDIIVLDLDIPGREGMSVLRGIREVDPLAPVIILSGSAERSLVEQVGQYGVRHYLLKPVQTSRLQQALMSILDAVRRAATWADEDDE